MQHDIEAKSKSHEEKRVPEKERQKCLEYFIEHGDVNIVSENSILMIMHGMA